MVKSGMQKSVMSRWDAQTRGVSKVTGDLGVGFKRLGRL